jgi:hypothetical protein
MFSPHGGTLAILDDGNVSLLHYTPSRPPLDKIEQVCYSGVGPLLCSLTSCPSAVRGLRSAVHGPPPTVLCLLLSAFCLLPHLLVSLSPCRLVSLFTCVPVYAFACPLLVTCLCPDIDNSPQLPSDGPLACEIFQFLLTPPIRVGQGPPGRPPPRGPALSVAELNHTSRAVTTAASLWDHSARGMTACPQIEMLTPATRDLPLGTRFVTMGRIGMALPTRHPRRPGRRVIAAFDIPEELPSDLAAHRQSNENEGVAAILVT